MFYVYFNQKRDMDLGMAAIERPSIPSPQRRVKTVTISGKDGDYYIDQDAYEDIPISINFNFIDRTNLQQKCRLIKSWLNKIKENELKFSDDLGVFYKVKKVECGDIERTFNIIGKFSVKFICDPYAWLSEGKESIVLNTSNTIVNDFEVTKPIYIITGEGNLTLNVNGSLVTINVGQKVTIDTNLQLCFKDNELINLALTDGKFEDLYLKEGANTMTYAMNGTLTSVQLIPNWKTL